MDYPVFYSIIIVCLNAGEKLADTVGSVLAQEYEGYEIVIKDGGSSDGSIEALNEKYSDGRLNIYCKGDTGIYDAMNQAVGLAGGEYFLFLNAGDSLYDNEVLNKMTEGILALTEKNKKPPDIVYGNMYHKALDTVIYPAPQINDFACYRNVPCHQTCFYNRTMFAGRGYRPEYNVRADYEHFLWCFYERRADICYLPVMTASYEGGGYSETRENKRRSAAQHREITMRYMGRKKACKYRIIMLMTLAPLRSALADSRYFSGIYNGVKTFLYSRKGEKQH